jgi:two-component system sensor histidine kinase KdpD
MLAAARVCQEAGMDVVAAFLEKPEHTFEISGCDQNGARLDLDIILARSPSLVLVDCMARANLPGSRHPQRWQDIQEILQQGIHVYTTLNVSEIASLSETASSLGFAQHWHSVPDNLVEQAELVLVDLPPEELLRRKPERALNFEIPALISLREMALNLTARHVDQQLQSTRHAGPLPARAHIMVCVSSHPISERLVRTGRRLGRDLNAEWVVVYVKTPDRLRYSRRHDERLSAILRLAEELGARVVEISGRTVPEAVIDYATNNHISQIIIGKPLRSRVWDFLNGSVVDEVIRLSGSIDVYVISDQAGPLDKGIPLSWRPHNPWMRYVFAALIVAGMSLICIPIHLIIEPTNLVMLYLLAVIFSAFYLGKGPSLLASLLSVLSFDFFFIEPRLSLSVYDTQYLLTFLGLFGTGLAISTLTGQVRSQVQAAQNREARMAALYDLSSELTTSVSLDMVMKTVLQHLEQTFDGNAVILLPGKNGLEMRAASGEMELSHPELEAASWAFQYGRPAGRGTGTFAENLLRWQPLQASHEMVGALGVQSTAPRQILSLEQRQLLEAYASLVALAIERASLAEQASRNLLLQEAEKLQSALLNSISHDLRTPLASVTGVLSSLHEAEAGDGEVVLDHATRLDLIKTGWEEAERLNRLVGNLLDMTRLEAGAIHLNLEDGDMEDVIGVALMRLRGRLAEYAIHTEISSNRPMVRMDAVLIEQVLVNLLDNAAKYSRPGSQIDVGFQQSGRFLHTWVADRGRGIPQEDLERVFEKFFRVQRPDGISGTGLGLSICKGIVEAHGGSIQAVNREEGGAKITFSLPAVISSQDTQGK